MYRRGWLRSILFDRTSILFRWASCISDPIHRILVPFPLTFACTMQDVVWSNQALADLFGSYVRRIHGCKDYRLFFPSRILPSRHRSWICDGSVNWLDIQYDKMCSKKLFGINTLSCSVCSINGIASWMILKSFGGKEFLVLTGQYSIEIFSCCFHFLPSCSSIHHQTNIDSAQI